jgi:hypothetical protein
MLLPGMTFRITSIRTDGGETLQIAGRMDSLGLDEVRLAVAAAKPPVTLDLSSLRHASADALSALGEWQAAGVTLIGMSQYMQMMLSRPRSPIQK